MPARPDNGTTPPNLAPLAASEPAQAFPPVSVQTAGRSDDGANVPAESAPPSLTTSAQATVPASAATPAARGDTAPTPPSSTAVLPDTANTGT